MKLDTEGHGLSLTENEISGISASMQKVRRLVVARTRGGGTGKWAHCGGDKKCSGTR